MRERPLTTAVALLIFNRPETTAQVFAAIRAARPTTLLVVADGPRPERAGEAERCAAARAVVEQVDWPCEVLRNYADVNLGCRRRVSSGLDWVFETVDEAIILEDDCVPHPTFFRFCAELLERYRDDERVMHIGGLNLQVDRAAIAGQASYYFSRYNHVWGWASWRRAWRHYDVRMSRWPAMRDAHWLRRVLNDTAAERFWADFFQAVFDQALDTWDVQWTLACWLADGLSILPAVNLIKNIGFGADATHTRGKWMGVSLETEPLSFPLQHPSEVRRNACADDFVQRTVFRQPPLLHRLASGLRRRLFT